MDTINPRYGGTVEAGRVLTAGLMKQGHSVEAVCLDRAGYDWYKAWPCQVHSLGPSHTPYLYCRELIPWLTAHADGFDAFLVHNVYRYISYGAWRSARASGIPYYLFTHGMLDPWFKDTHPFKHVKKTVFWKLIGAKMFHEAAAILYTCEEEKARARSSFSPYDCTERVVGLGIADPRADGVGDSRLFRGTYPQLNDTPYLLFLGRITRIKRVDLLIEAFAQVYGHGGQTRLVIAGPDDNGLQARLAALPAAKKLGERLVWTGYLNKELKWSAIAGAEAMALFSHSENFAINVSESLALSIPVLITDKVKIWREVANGEAGFVDSDDLEGAIRSLTKWRSAPPAARSRMKLNARETFDKHFEVGITVRQLVAALEETSTAALAN